MIFIGLSADGQLRTVSIGISPSPGTPPTAQKLRKYHCHSRLSSPRRMQSNSTLYKCSRSLPRGRSSRTYKCGLAAHHRIAQIMYLMNDIQFSRIGKGVFNVPSPNSLGNCILAGCFSKIFFDFFHGSIEVLYNGIFVESVSSADFSER